MKLSNLGIIKRAAKMGYSSIFEYDDSVFKVVATSAHWVETVCNEGNFCYNFSPWKLKRSIITGYLSVGELFGKPEIPEGQKFRMKDTGEILEFERYQSCCSTNDTGLFCTSGKDGKRADVYYPNEIEPYFD